VIRHNSIRLAVLGISVLSAGLTFAAPAAAQDASAAPAASAEAFQVVYVTPDLSIPFWKYLSDGIHQEAAKVGATVTDLSSSLDPATQLKNVQDSITKQVDLIILSPTDSSSAPTVLQAAADAGVPVVIADIGTESGDYVSFIITNNFDGAKASAEAMAKALAANGCPNGPIAMFQINQARINGQNRTKGAMEAFDAAGVKVVQNLEAQTYTRDEGKKFAQDVMTAHPDLCGFWSQYDEGSLGAVNAIADAGKEGQVLVGGFDGIREVIDAIKAGKIVAASVQQPIGMGRESFKAGYDFLTGGTPAKEIDMPTILVTPETVDSLMSQLEDTVFPPE
jgi:ribose transport system substrate-binding protein